jgi:hypothetical protein
MLFFLNKFHSRMAGNIKMERNLVREVENLLVSLPTIFQLVKDRENLLVLAVNLLVHVPAILDLLKQIKRD